MAAVRRVCAKVLLIDHDDRVLLFSGQEETYFLVRVPGGPPSDGRWTEVEKATIVAHRWWTVEELRCTDEAVHPEGLADILERFL